MPSAAPTAGTDGGKQERTKGYIVVSLSYMKDLTTVICKISQDSCCEEAPKIVKYSKYRK